MPEKPVSISGHARFEMRRRGITEAQVIRVLRHAEQVVPSRKGRHIHQSRVAGGRLLLRVVVKEAVAAYHVVTAYKTAKIVKYWKRT
jgi:hypothetical protein